MLLRKGKILLLGKSGDLDNVSNILTDLGYKVETVERPGKALGKALRDFPKPKLVITQQQVIDGIPVAELAREYSLIADTTSMTFLVLVNQYHFFYTPEKANVRTLRYAKMTDDPSELESKIKASVSAARPTIKPHPKKKTKAQYIIDEMTGLYNKIYLNERLKEEFARAKRYNYPVSLALIYPDEFDKVRQLQSRGKAEGIIKQLGDIIRRNVRGIDIITRYNADSFAVLLPQTGRKGAKVLGDKLRKVIERHLFFGVPGKNRFTVSIGIAACNESDISSVKKIIAASERAIRSSCAKGNKITVVWV